MRKHEKITNMRLHEKFSSINLDRVFLYRFGENLYMVSHSRDGEAASKNFYNFKDAKEYYDTHAKEIK